MKSTLIYLFTIIIAGLIIVGCDKEDIVNPIPTDPLEGELAKVISATEKYQNMDNAISDGYEDIDLFAPNQGWHYLNAGLLDEIFDMEKPEILVYAPGPIGGLILVAVEYAVPVTLSPDAPTGFTGEDDVWHINTDFGLWVLHTWVWSDNPDGMFNNTNPLVTQNQLDAELAKVRSATERYQDMDNALANEYEDIELFAPNQGWHYLNAGLLDEIFDMDKPEILVYAPGPNGGLILVAVEYAIPVALSPNTPEGFAGADDVWHINEDFGLWVLHTWVWYDNPDGMLNGTNSRVTQNPLEGELAKVRSATERYQDMANALSDQYEDIELFAANQGWHYLKASLVDEFFDMEKPEILVYSPDSNGGLMLVAVEYAVPVDLSPDAPDGFTGAEDVWHINEDFGLWVLHTWVWYDNPDGMFNGTNPRVPTEP